MKKSKILFLIMAFALTFVFAINVKAGCSSKSGAPESLCGSVSCSGDYTACVSGSGNICCQWSDPTCTGNTELNPDTHECVPKEVDKTCDAGYAWSETTGACAACTGQWYKPSRGTGACQWCEGTVTGNHTGCNRTTNATVTASATSTNLQPGESATVSGTLSPSGSGSATCSGSGVSGCTVSCPADNTSSYTVDVTVGWEGAPSNYNITPGTVSIICNAAEGTNLVSITANATTLWVSPSESAGLSLSGHDAEGRPVKSDWTGSTHISASCTNSAQCGAVVTADKCKTVTETVSATGSGTNTGSASVSITIVGYADWSKSTSKVSVPADLRTHTRHEAETTNSPDQIDRCVAYEEVDPVLGIGYRYDRCCGSGTTELPYCYEKTDGTREVTTYKEGYVKKDDKYCEKACYKKSDGTYTKAWYEDGYEKVEDRFCESTPTPHCYKKPDGTYEKTTYQEGYVQVDDEYCVPACFKKTDGTYEKTNYQEGFVKVDDKYCEKACYKKPDETFEYTTYQDGYEKVEDSNCADIPVTGATVSKIVYALSLFLVMAGSGIVVYQLTKTKKELDQ